MTLSHSNRRVNHFTEISYEFTLFLGEFYCLNRNLVRAFLDSDLPLDSTNQNFYLRKCLDLFQIFRKKEK